MPEPDTEHTLPSVTCAASGAGAQLQLLLTVLFHPDVERIGEVARVRRTRDGRPCVLGRNGPDFCAPATRPVPLGDPHVSRRALELDFNGDRVVVRRMEGSSRARLAGGELFEQVVLDNAALRRGVPLLLSHSIVLLLRLAPPPAQDELAAGALLGGSSTMQRLRAAIRAAGRSQLDVLIRGETGSGKELVAAALHAASARADKPMVSVNMAAIPPELAPAMLFGSARGAFTGADRASAGYFREAGGGTLFLDEIGDTPRAVQPQLLRALQQREIQSGGGAIERVDVRVISATDAALDDPASGFSAALRHRLGALEIEVPPLREHPEDIGELLLACLESAARQSGDPGRLPRKGMEQPAVAAWSGIFFAFACHDWPGNVRELSNRAQQLLFTGDGVPSPADPVLRSLAATPQAAAVARRRRMQDIDDDQFDRAMRDNRFEIKAVAGQLGVSRTSVYRRIEQSGDYRLAGEIPEDVLRDALVAHSRSVADAAASLRVSASGLASRVRKLRLL
ncbi:MAG: sigma 54-interacting transcriptional regulator [Halioglobus sp.]|nr:sigma 54-interacting transcriptional regulator [Halioglobus sp.]